MYTRASLFPSPLPPPLFFPKLKATRVWEASDNWQLSVGVRIVPYECDLFAIWVYLLASKPN
eukprot:m.92611 g.92611  ORF g.92611 m.92611 type:complete len:62 (-) comp8896_c0_seq3:432-617(-)